MKNRRLSPAFGTEYLLQYTRTQRNETKSERMMTMQRTVITAKTARCPLKTRETYALRREYLKSYNKRKKFCAACAAFGFLLAIAAAGGAEHTPFWGTCLLILCGVGLMFGAEAALRSGILIKRGRASAYIAHAVKTLCKRVTLRVASLIRLTECLFCSKIPLQQDIYTE